MSKQGKDHVCGGPYFLSEPIFPNLLSFNQRSVKFVFVSYCAKDVQCPFLIPNQRKVQHLSR